MRMARYEDEAAPSRYLAARIRKIELERNHEIHCGRCRYHRGENRTHTTRHSDVRKLHVKWKEGR